MAEPQTQNTCATHGDFKLADNAGTDYTTERWAKGELIDGGVSGIVELLPNGYVIKSPWPGWW